MITIATINNKLLSHIDLKSRTLMPTRSTGDTISGATQFSWNPTRIQASKVAPR